MCPPNVHTKIGIKILLQSLFLRTRLPAAGSATTTFLFAVLPRKAVAAAFSFAALAAVDFAAAGTAAALLVRVFGAGTALVAAAARVPRFGLTTVVPVDSADDSEMVV